MGELSLVDGILVHEVLLVDLGVEQSVIEGSHAELLEFFSADASLFSFIFDVFVSFNTVHHVLHGSEVIAGVSESGEEVSTEAHSSFVSALG